MFSRCCSTRSARFSLSSGGSISSTALLALDATLDFALGGTLARELSRAYRGAANAIEDADDRDLPELCRGIEQLIAELAESWKRLD